MRKVIFLDRDGVINKERGEYTYKVTDFIINEGVINFLKSVQGIGFDLIIITNQGGISKGIYNKNDVCLVHDHMLTLFKKEGITILDIYYCPHHSDLEKCICRKPDSLMLEKAIARFNIDKSLSFMIGDSQRDIEAATKAGIKSFKIESNTNLNQLGKYLF
jgi:D-glycero-D-manno-heptose 1,7-bisphosphate phosphatase